MARIEPFEAHTERYEAWFERHDAAYISELLALRPFVPLTGRGLEIGVGSGRFAAPLGVQVGIDPSRAMLDRARARGIEVLEGIAEDLPFADDSFDHALVVVNAGKTAATYAYDAPSPYCDVRGNAVPSPVTLKSRTAMLLIKNPSILSQ